MTNQPSKLTDTLLGINRDEHYKKLAEEIPIQRSTNIAEELEAIAAKREGIEYQKYMDRNPK